MHSHLGQFSTASLYSLTSHNCHQHVISDVNYYVFYVCIMYYASECEQQIMIINQQEHDVLFKALIHITYCNF